MMLLASYLLKVIICSGILFLYYHLTLRNKLFHQWNRFYLLAAVVLSLTAPLVEIQLTQSTDSPGGDIVTILSAQQYLDPVIIYTAPSSTPESLILPVYGLVSIILLAILLASIVRLLRVIRAHTIKKVNNISFINTSVRGTPFSFFHFIFWNQEIDLQSETGQHIFEHELVHVKEKHSVDKIFMQLVLIVFWCNPFFWLIRRELKMIHEFIADKKAVGEHGAAAFAAMILQASFKTQYDSITNQFFQTSIKRRLHMITKMSSPRLSYFSRIIALPIVAVVTLAFSTRNDNAPAGEPREAMQIIKDVNASDTIPDLYHKGKRLKDIQLNNTKEKAVITYMDGKRDTVASNELSLFVVPPPPAPERKISGNVHIIVNGKEFKGSLDLIDPKNIESVNVLKSESAAEKYGVKGKEGVLLITLKPGVDPNIIQQGNNKSSIVEIVVDGRPIKEVVVEGKPLNNKEAIIEISPTTESGKKERVDKIKEAVVVGQPLEQISNIDEPIFEKSEIEASVNMSEWRKFLEVNLQPVVKELAASGAKPGQYTVMLRFIVEKNGELTDLRCIKDPGYDLCEKVKKVMVNSPKWSPAQQNRRIVRSYHTQPVTIVIADQ